MTDDPGELAERVVAGDRRALAQAITMVESTRPDHRAAATGLLDTLLPRTGNAIRVGISGPPGVGKSTLIEALGLLLVSTGRRVAVLAVDPSSARSGGSILGDKTRMDELARHSEAFIRPTPSRGTLGGVARRTREAALVCEAAGFDVVLVETVGVGQSEIEVDGMVDVFALLVAAGGGDELQGIKRGVMELADVVIVTKADGDLLRSAQQAEADHRHALGLLRPKHAGISPRVLLCSAVQHEGVDRAWTAITDVHAQLEADGRLAARRRQQQVDWLWAEVHDGLLRRVREGVGKRQHVDELEEAVRSGARSAPSAAAELLREVG